jgi:hypothetical protein
MPDPRGWAEKAVTVDLALLETWLPLLARMQQDVDDSQDALERMDARAQVAALEQARTHLGRAQDAVHFACAALARALEVDRRPVP